MTTTKKLTDAQRSALKKMYTEVRSGQRDYARTSAGTINSLYKMGLLGGTLEPKTRRGAECVVGAKINDAGMALAHELFGMDWWVELIGAFISHERAAQMRQEKIAKAQSIAQALNLETELELSGDKERGYSGSYDSELIIIRVSKTYFNLRENGYVITTNIKAFYLTESQTRLVAELLCDAANVLHVFKGAE